MITLGLTATAVYDTAPNKTLVAVTDSAIHALNDTVATLDATFNAVHNTLHAEGMSMLPGSVVCCCNKLRELISDLRQY